MRLRGLLPLSPRARRNSQRERDLVRLVGEFTTSEMLDFYRGGWFPMPAPRPRQYYVYNPRRRAVLPLSNLRVTRSLRQSMKRYRVSLDEAFADVLAQCAGRRAPTDWIDPLLIDRYTELHALGHAHSVEVWDAADNLTGGLFAVNIGGLVCGESMFHIGRDASKTALVHLVELLRDSGSPVLLDAQFQTPHLASLGVVEIDRADYLATLPALINLPNVL